MHTCGCGGSRQCRARPWTGTTSTDRRTTTRRAHATCSLRASNTTSRATTTLRNTSRYGRYTLAAGDHRRQHAGQSAVTGHRARRLVVTAPAAWTVSRSRQRRDEVNEILTNQTNLHRLVQHRLHPAFAQQRFRVHLPSVSCRAASASIGTAQAANLYYPAARRIISAAPASNGAASDGKDRDRGALYVFDTLKLTANRSLNVGLALRPTSARSIPTLRRRVGATRHPLSCKTYFEGDGDLAHRQGWAWCSSRLENASIYAAYATSEQPPGGADCSHSMRNRDQRQQPEPRPAEGRATSSSAPSGTCWTTAWWSPRRRSTRRNKNDLARPDATRRNRPVRRAQGARHRAGRLRHDHAGVAGAARASRRWTPRSRKAPVMAPPPQPHRRAAAVPSPQAARSRRGPPTSSRSA